MNNIVGQPVEGEDFFDRSREVASIWESLEEGNQVLLLAPRRVGKTSLALRVGEKAKSNGWKFAWVDVQKDRDELGVLSDLLENLQFAGLKLPLLARLSNAIAMARRQVAGKVEVWGMSLEMGDPAHPQTATLEHLVNQLFTQLEDAQDKILVAVDELPVFLGELFKADSSMERLRAFLNWFRALRMRFRKTVRWLLLGSVGLDSFVETHLLTATINDLNTANLGAYTEEDAVAFLKALGRGKKIEMTDAVCIEVLSQIGWPLPFFLQLVFHRLYSNLGGQRRIPEPADVETACRQLTGCDFYKHFEPWRGRLAEGMGPDEFLAATTILNSLCVQVKGQTREALLGIVRPRFPQRDAGQMAHLLAAVLGQLERDGYLLRTADEPASHYAFRSFLLRQYWQAREIL
jgi:AAA+ ATPase superfamily predicted ATPase